MSNVFSVILKSAAIIGFLACTHCGAQESSKPFSDGDTWTYRQTVVGDGATKKVGHVRFGVVFFAKNGSMALGFSPAKIDGVTPVWTLSENVPAETCIRDFLNKASLGIEDTCKVRLETGKKWEINRADSLSREVTSFTVLGQEQVVVPVGQFNAIKINEHSVVTTVAYAGVAPPPWGYEKITRTTYWYAPEVKAMVKVVREFDPPNSSLKEIMTEELVAYTGLGLPAKRNADFLAAEANRFTAINVAKPCEMPIWPREALMKELTGAVTMKFMIDVDGRVLDKGLIWSSGHAVLDIAALEAIGRCTFKPVLKDGKAQVAWGKIGYVWTLE